MSGKIRWCEYYHKKDEFVAASIERIQKYGVDTFSLENIIHYNTVAWEIFLKSNDISKLNIAIDFMKESLKSDLNKECIPKVQWDTYASLLYKVGRTSEAIKWEEKGVNGYKSFKYPFYEYMVKEYTDTLEKDEKR